MNRYRSLIVLLLSILIIFACPVSTFAVNRHVSSVEVDDACAEADGEERIKFTVYLFNEGYAPANGGTIYVASEREDLEKFYEKDAEDPKPGAGYYEFKDTDNDGKIEFEVSSHIDGQVKIAVGLNKKVADYVLGNDVSANEAGIIHSEECEFQANEVKRVELYKVESRTEKYSFKESAGVYSLSSSKVYPDANDADYYQITFRVTNEKGNPIEGEKVKFSFNKTTARVNKDMLETDKMGEVKVKAYSSEVFYAGRTGSSDLELYAEAGSNKKATVMLPFSATSPHTIELHMSTPNNQIVAKKQKDKEFTIYLYDAMDNKVKYKKWEGELEDDLSYEVIREPEGSDIEDEISFEPDSMKNRTDMVIGSFEKEGFYNIRLSIDSGDYIDVGFTVKEQEKEITELKLEYEEKAISLGAKTDLPTITRVDKNGVEYELDESDIQSDMIFSVNDPQKIADISDKGVLTITDDDDHKGELLITVIDKDNNLTANHLMSVAGEPSGIRLNPPTITKTGETAKVVMQVIDENGNLTALGQNMASRYPKVSFSVVEEPEEAYVGCDDGSMFSSKMKEDGLANLEITCNKPGTVKVAVMLEVKNSAKGAAAVTMVDEVLLNFGDKKAAFNDNVKLYLGIPGYYVDGQMKVMEGTPFAEEGKVYIPVRTMAEIFGAELTFDKEKQEIVLDNKEKQVYLKIGSSMVRVSDAPAIMADGMVQIVEGRTYVPYRVVAEAFGALVEPVTDDANEVVGVQLRMYEEEEDEEE